MESDPAPRAFVFPGQGSQSVGMLGGFADSGPFRDVFKEAGDVLGMDLGRLIAEGPSDELNRTSNTQPALLAVEVALWRLARQRGVAAPDFLAGHSLGEYSALVVAGTLSLAAGLGLVRLRGELMQKASPQDSLMVAILGLDDAAVEACCRAAANAGLVESANFNAPGQVVIGGHERAVQRAAALCKQRGARKTMPLAVSVPAHTSLMRPAAAQFAEALAGVPLQAPLIPIVRNYDAAISRDVESIRSSLVMHMYSPVQWRLSILKLRSLGVLRFFECGPGKVLGTLIRRIDRQAEIHAVESTVHIGGPAQEGL